jgi:uncharacterized pyridoxal phosphate-containing UPF0001 family protein
VVGTAELIHSVDSLGLLEEIAKQAERRDLVQRCLLQVNVGAERQKSGCAPGELAALVERARALDHVTCEGLMCVPPFDVDPLPFFVELRTLAVAHQLPQLSMGMSADFPVAIANGATLIRVGTAIFGERPIV